MENQKARVRKIRKVLGKAISRNSNKKAFARGVISSFDFTGSQYSNYTKRGFISNDFLAMKHDWDVTGMMIKKSMREFKKMIGSNYE